MKIKLQRIFNKKKSGFVKGYHFSKLRNRLHSICSSMTVFYITLCSSSSYITKEFRLKSVSERCCFHVVYQASVWWAYFDTWREFVVTVTGKHILILPMNRFILWNFIFYCMFLSHWMCIDKQTIGHIFPWRKHL